MAADGQALLAAGAPDHVVASSKTFRTLARLAGAAPSSSGPRTPRIITRDGLRQVTSFISRMSSSDLAELDGVSPGRAHQTLAGAVVAASAMDALGVAQLDFARGRCARASSCGASTNSDGPRDPSGMRHTPGARAPTLGRALDRVGVPGVDRGRLRDRGAAGVRRRRGHGLDRSGQPGSASAAQAWPSTTTSRSWPCTPPA